MPDEAARLALAELALSLARQGGADYADIRLGATLQDYICARDERLETVWSGESWGFGLRVLRRGSWGFCGATSLTPEAIRRAVETALANARAVEPIQGAPIALEALPVVEDRWEMALGVDPHPGLPAQISSNYPHPSPVFVKRRHCSFKRTIPNNHGKRSLPHHGFCGDLPYCHNQEIRDAESRSPL